MEGLGSSDGNGVNTVYFTPGTGAFGHQHA
jgi:hypothetical protein